MKRFRPSSALLTGRFPIFSILLAATGCFLLPVTAMAQVSAHFTADHTTGCGQLSVQFTDQSTGNPSSWNWDFGNGNHSTRQNPNAAFTSPGDYTVTLKVSNGASVSTAQQTIHVYAPPKISIDASPTQGCAPLAVQFTDQSTGGSGSITGWTWDFGDGSPFSTRENPSHTYDSAGTFTVNVSVTNSAGCTSSTSGLQIVTDQGAAVSFSALDTFSCTNRLSTQFRATSSGSGAVSYLWDFGDGTTASGQTPSHTYTGKGIYTVTLTASVGGGVCSFPVTRPGYINVGNPASDFIVPQGCANAPLTFQNTSVPLPSSATWTFSDGGTASGINATHTFKAPGTYSVTLTNNYNGCTNSVTKSITTYPSPRSDFSVPNQVFCGKPASVTFSNLSTGATSWRWKFGDSSTSAAQAPSHSYAEAGSYDVTLIATNSNGCTDSVTRAGYIKVDAPDIRFNASPGYGCVPMTTSFSIPPDPSGSIAAYAWDFGDGSTSTDAAPSHQYTSAGSFSVSLKVTTGAGCSFTFSRPNYIHTGMKPVVDFDATPLNVCLSKPVQFTNKSNPPGSIWTWTFPEDHGHTDSLQNPLYNFTSLGKQDVTLTVINNGCSSSLTKTGLITVKPPLAAFTFSSSCADPYTIRFTDQSTAGTTSWKWDFGDGTSSTSQNPSHTYKTAGIKMVTLFISNGSCDDSTLIAVPVIDEQPTVTVPAGIICHGSRVSLSAANIRFPQFVSSVTFQSGDGSSKTVRPDKDSIPAAFFSYMSNGTYTPSLVLTDTNGCQRTVSGPVITVQGPSAAFTTSTPEICQGSQVTFRDNSTPDPSTAAITQWMWDYGDGKSDVTTADSSLHTYLQNGKFPAGLKITDANGCTDSIRSTASPLVVHPSLASFSTLDTMVCPGSVIHWDNKSQGEGTAYLWDFGDGTTSTLADPPDKTYSRDSLYSVSLHITTSNGCRDSMTRTGYIRVGTPKAVMADNSPVRVCRLFRDTAISLSQNGSGVLWDFGDGTVSANETAYHLYNVPGTYIQTLTVNGFSAGCAADTQRRITITGPIGRTIMDDTSGCSPHTVHFSARDVTTAVKYQWDFGNGDYSGALTSPRATYTYAEEGLFHPKLLLTDANGCTVIIPINDTLTVIVDSIGLRSDHKWPDVCDSNKVAFGTPGSIFSKQKLGQAPAYFWDFGDPGTVSDISNQAEPTYRYMQPGTYHPTVTVTTAFGCRETLQDTVTVPDSVALKVMATANPGVICQGASIQLSAASNRDVVYNWTPLTGLEQADRGTVTAMPPASMTYTVTASTKDACQTDTAAVPVVVHPLPKVDAGQDQTVSTGSVVQLQATGSSDVTEWSWTPADYLNCTHCVNPVSTPRQPVTYTLTATTGFGCTDSAKVVIHLVCDEGKVFIPNTFTPNHDGKNDIFYPRGRGVKTVLYFRIFDRFGQLVFERTNFPLNDKAAAWDGTYKGRKLDPAVFVYSTAMICDNNQVFKLSGNITLLR